MSLVLKDNSSIEINLVDYPIISSLLNKSLKELTFDHFILFPPRLENSIDLLKENYIFESNRNYYRTSNIIGIINQGKNEVRINSRFYNSKSESDYFLRYLMESILDYNIIDSDISANIYESYYELLIYMFPYYLNNAMQKGIYKEYMNKKYNNANLKGKIRFNSHIRKNIPFTGNISYQTREFNLDNNLNQLIRHTINKIETDNKIHIFNDNITIENVRLIKETATSYKKSELNKVVNYNILNKIVHPYFIEYSDLQKLCLQILQEGKVGINNNDQSIHGIIIDISWLWEDYLGKLLKKMLIHPDNRTKNSLYFFEEGRKIYPDFHSIDKKLVLDAKYKNLGSTIQREDLYQLTSYLHVMKSKSAGLIYPNSEKEFKNPKHVGQLRGYGGNFYKIPLNIPQESDSYHEFKKKMEVSESVLLSNIEDLLKNNS